MQHNTGTKEPWTGQSGDFIFNALAASHLGLPPLCMEHSYTLHRRQKLRASLASRMSSFCLSEAKGGLGGTEGVSAPLIRRRTTSAQQAQSCWCSEAEGDLAGARSVQHALLSCEQCRQAHLLEGTDRAVHQ